MKHLRDQEHEDLWLLETIWKLARQTKTIQGSNVRQHTSYRWLKTANLPLATWKNGQKSSIWPKIWHNERPIWKRCSGNSSWEMKTALSKQKTSLRCNTKIDSKNKNILHILPTMGNPTLKSYLDTKISEKWNILQQETCFSFYQQWYQRKPLENTQKNPWGYDQDPNYHKHQRLNHLNKTIEEKLWARLSSKKEEKPPEGKGDIITCCSIFEPVRPWPPLQAPLIS